jgi:hypothetical protein
LGLGGGFFQGLRRLGVHVPALLTKPGGFIDLRGNGWRGGFVLGGRGTAIRDEAFDGDDHGERLDLAGNAPAGHFGAEVGDFPEAVQDLVAARSEPALSLHGTPGQVHGTPGQAGQVGILLDELLLDGGAMLQHVSADTRLGFGVRSGVGVETGDLRGTTVGHVSSEDQVGERYFLVRDGVADLVFGHRWLRFG